MNNDLISRSALFKKIQPVDFLYGHDEDAPYSGMAVDACDVEAAPAVDAVEVVRCKDCGWYNTDSETCGFWPDEGYRDPKHFCGEGKPK